MTGAGFCKMNIFHVNVKKDDKDSLFAIEPEFSAPHFLCNSMSLCSLNVALGGLDWIILLLIFWKWVRLID